MEFKIIEHNEAFENDCHEKFGCYRKKYFKLKQDNEEGNGHGNEGQKSYIYIYFNQLQSIISS